MHAFSWVITHMIPVILSLVWCFLELTPLKRGEWQTLAAVRGRTSRNPESWGEAWNNQVKFIHSGRSTQVIFLSTPCYHDCWASHIFALLFIYIYIFNLFIFGWAGSLLLCRLLSSCGKRRLLSSCSAHTSDWDGFSCCRAWALGRTGFSSCGTWLVVSASGF